MAAYISRIVIENFRNFEKLDLEMAEQTVLVGENKAGKSNLIYALRLVLDPSMPDSMRILRKEDFWDGLENPMENSEEIKIELYFKGFKDNEKLLALLSDYLVEEGVAKISYLFKPVPMLSRPGEFSYHFKIFGGENEDENRFGGSQRTFMPLEVLPALRNAEEDLYSWRKSPLRPLIESLEVEVEDLEAAARKIDEATDDIMEIEEISQLGRRIEERLEIMVGSEHTVSPSLAIAQTDAAKLLKNLRLYVDGDKQRAIGDTSLGICNVIYLCLLNLELERKEASGERAITFLAIEEPEAHLHPHLQRLVFRDFFSKRESLILTTHSPHIVSISPSRSLALLKQSEGKSVGASTATSDLTEDQQKDIERYLDATRGEILFAKGLILVEGDAELYLVPEIARKMGCPLDERGITVCSVHGTDFMPYVKLVKEGGLGIPFVVLTDGDPYQSDGATQYRAVNRSVKLVKELKGARVSTALLNVFSNEGYEDFVTKAQEYCIFLNDHTLEVELSGLGYDADFVEVYGELGGSETLQARMKEEIESDNFESWLGRIERVGKGRFAQRFAGKITADKIPNYIKAAVQRITGEDA